MRSESDVLAVFRAEALEARKYSYVGTPAVLNVQTLTSLAVLWTALAVVAVGLVFFVRIPSTQAFPVTVVSETTQGPSSFTYEVSVHARAFRSGMLTQPARLLTRCAIRFPCIRLIVVARISAVAASSPDDSFRLTVLTREPVRPTDISALVIWNGVVSLEGLLRSRDANIARRS